ncbi:recombinase family protein [Halarcobacter bivalviorum]|uniref:Resolvase n=1 Tax=Halarcobacter bivalviorum TaxID=663364 RepID=A0AAX2AAU3_9BACT|nr:recombinase family protein [Halarcobacter bivalviorum]AXH12516.1 resolvase [Halarcobacter bivalviorum]RXK07963.1 resolvase [Halarcobacter bivalviorum]RXK10561.1 resolvase [Halarcobacter bivalviorum]
MSRVLSFVRVNNNNEVYTKSQVEGIEKYVEKNNISISQNIEIEIDTPDQEKNILEFLKNCEASSTLLVYDLNVFGRTIETILEIVKFLLSNKIRIIVIKQNLDLIDDKDMLTQMILGVISMTVGLEKELMSLRTKEALTAKKLKGENLGKPKGTIQKSKFDKQRDKIEELLAVGLSVRKIAKLLGYNNHIGLNNYVKKRNIRHNLPNTLDIAS